MKQKNITLFVICAVLFCGILAGCASAQPVQTSQTAWTEQSGNLADTSKIEEAAQFSPSVDTPVEEQEIGFSFSKELISADYDNVRTLRSANGELYSTVSTFSEEDVTYIQRFIKMSFDGETIREYPFERDLYSSLLDYYVTTDESIWFLENTFSGSDQYFLKRIDKNGQLILEVELYLDDDDSYTLRVDSANNAYVFCYNNLMIFTEAGELLHTIELGFMYEHVSTIDDVYIIEVNSGRVEAKMIDPQSGTLSVPFILFETSKSQVFGVQSADSERLYLSDGEYLYYYELSTATSGTLFSWSDIRLTEQEPTLTFVNNETFASSVTANSAFKMLTYGPITPDTRKIITYATMYQYDNYSSEILSFNVSSDEYYIQTVSYYDGDYNDAITQLNLDIISGNAPDIIDLNGLPKASYIEKGLLVDLNTLLDTDDEISRNDLVPGVLTALEQGGGLYSISPRFSITTMFGKTSLVGQYADWNVYEFYEYLQSIGGGTNAMFAATSYSVLYEILRATMDDYVDYDTLTCDFTSDEFITLLNAANTFGKYDQDTSDFMQINSEYGYYERLRVNQSTINSLYTNQINEYFDWENYYVGEPLTILGFPSKNGGATSVEIINEFGITTLGGCTEGAWEFIKFLLSEEMQSEISFNFPVRKSTLESILYEYASEPEEDMTGVSMLVGGTSYPYVQVSESQVESYLELIYSADSLYNNDWILQGIIEEETAAYFTGSKTAEAVAKIIQSRASIYLSEQG